MVMSFFSVHDDDSIVVSSEEEARLVPRRNARNCRGARPPCWKSCHVGSGLLLKSVPVREATGYSAGVTDPVSAAPKESLAEWLGLNRSTVAVLAVIGC